MRKIITILPSLSIGGAEKVALNLAINYSNSDFKSILVVIGNRIENQYLTELEKARIECHFLGIEGKVSLNKIRKFIHDLDALNPDIVHVHLDLVYSWIWAIIRRRKIYFTIHNQPYRIVSKSTKFFSRILESMEKITWIAVSDIIKKEALELLPIKSTVYVVNNPIDLSLYYRSLKSRDTVALINVGRFNRIKRQDLIIKAFTDVHKKWNNSELILVGDGEELEKCRKLACELGVADSTIFTGNSNRVQDYLAASDLYISASDTEASPVSIVEAMASHLPIIATNVGGVSELVSDNGILIKKDDKDELVKAILELLNNTSKKDQMGNSSYRKSREYSIENSVSRYMEIFENETTDSKH